MYELVRTKHKLKLNSEQMEEAKSRKKLFCLWADSYVSEGPS
jgi:hypothetical protein